MREELHVVTIAGCHELQAPESEHRAWRQQVWPACHLESEREQRMIVTQLPYLASQLSVSGLGDPEPTSNDVACPCL